MTVKHVRTMREENPRALAINIAKDLGVSRERVRQILKRLGLPTRIPREPVNWCCYCVKPIHAGRMYCTNKGKCSALAHRVKVLCRGCGVSFITGLSDYHNRIAQSKTGQLWCSRPCWSKTHRHQLL